MHIVEIENPEKMKLNKIKMSADDMDGMEQVKEPLHRTASFYMMVGPPQSGKTNLVFSMLLKRKRFYNQMFENVHVFSNSIHTISEKMNLDEDRIHKGLDFAELEGVVESIPKDERLLLVFDDLITSIQKNIKIFLRIVFNRRHIGKGCHVWLISQKLNKIPAELRSGANGLFMFKSPNNYEIETLYQEFFNMPRDEFRQILDHCWKKRHDFMFLKLDEVESKKYYHCFNLLKFTSPHLDHESLPNAS